MKIVKVYISDLGYLMIATKEENTGVICNYVAGSLRDILPEKISKLPIETTSGFILNETKDKISL